MGSYGILAVCRIGCWAGWGWSAADVNFGYGGRCSDDGGTAWRRRYVGARFQGRRDVRRTEDGGRGQPRPGHRRVRDPGRCSWHFHYEQGRVTVCDAEPRAGRQRDGAGGGREQRVRELLRGRAGAGGRQGYGGAGRAAGGRGRGRRAGGEHRDDRRGAADGAGPPEHRQRAGQRGRRERLRAVDHDDGHAREGGGRSRWRSTAGSSRWAGRPRAWG